MRPPPGDPWYSPPRPGTARAGAGAGDAGLQGPDHAALVSENNRFWYRNDLAGGAREFILVDAETRHARAGLRPQQARGGPSKAAGRPVIKADRLPFDEIDFVDDGAGRSVSRSGETTWNAVSIPTNAPSRPRPPAAEPPGAETAPRRSASEPRGPRRRRRARSRRARSPDGKWTAFVKDHNVFVRAEGEGRGDPAQRRRQGGPRLRPALVVARFEDAGRVPDRARRAQGGLPDPVVAAGRRPGQAPSRGPIALPGDKFTAYELNLFDVAAKKQIKPEVDRIDFGEPRLRWDEDGRHFTYEKIDRGHQRFRLIEVDSQTGEARNLIDEKTDTFIWTAHTREPSISSTVNWLDEVGRDHLRLRARRLAAPLPDRRQDRRGQEPDHARASTSSGGSTGSTRTSGRSGSAPAARTRTRTRTSSTTTASTSTAPAWSP